LTLIQAEIDTLTKYAALVPDDGIIVEIGTHMGDSTVVMAEAQPKAKIWTIDTGERYLWEQGEDGKLDDYIDILTKRFESHNIFFMLGSSHSGTGVHVVKWTGEPISLLFIDGDHGYKAFMSDLVRWAPKVLPGGYMLLHDYVPDDFGKVWGAANDYLDGYPQWEIVELVSTMLVLRRGNHLP
jgi:cephalosporin hydroxylase